MRARSKATLLAICLAILVGLFPATVHAKSSSGAKPAPPRVTPTGQKWG